jgi:hypothetical protein
MKQYERKLFTFLSIIFIVLAFLLIALAFGSATRRTIALLPTTTGYEDEFFALRLRASDLPRGYQGQRIPDLVKVESGTGYDYIFELQPLSDSFSIVHRIIIFETSEVTNAAFDKTLTQRRGTEFHVNEGIDVTKDKPYANNIAWGCDQPVTTANSQFTISTRYCIAVATYQNVYVEIRGQTFTNEYLTMEKYFALVKRLDQRAGEVLKISKPE